ncbi:MAG: rod shape-determining protein MreD [Proteobacteria bacterium]|nr:rod shape-determining protein MreD [Pseudomonadota bacterium]
MSFWVGLLKIPGLNIIWPDYIMGVLFFWTLYRPHLIPLGFLVVLGIIDDILSGNILGQAPLLWILFYIGALSQRKFLIKKSFKKIWIFFSFTFLGYLGLKWIFMCMFQRCQGLFFLMLIQFLMTVGAYPFITLLLIQVKKGVSFKVTKEAE